MTYTDSELNRLTSELDQALAEAGDKWDAAPPEVRALFLESMKSGNVLLLMVWMPLLLSFAGIGLAAVEKLIAERERE